jgi:hypothetical protein
MSRSIVDHLSLIYAAANGAAPPSGFGEAVFAALASAGVHDDTYVPSYVADGLARLAAGETTAWTDVPEPELGMSWLLRELLPVLPGVELRETPERTTYAVPALGLALAIATSNTLDRWAVLPDDGGARAAARDATPAEPAVTSFGSFAPTPEQIRRWARDPSVRLVLEDEDLALEHDGDLALLGELAADPAVLTAKRATILAVLHRLITIGLWRDGSAGLWRIDTALDRIAAGERAHGGLPDETRRWAAVMARLRDHVRSTGPIAHDDARELAAALLRGPGPADVTVVERPIDGWWEFAASRGGAPHDYLYVYATSGALRWSHTARTASELAAPGPARLP